VAVAYAISRKVGNAVVRNRIRRRLRALFDELDPQPQPGKYLIRCGNETGKLSYEELQHHLLESLDRAGALRGDVRRSALLKGLALFQRLSAGRVSACRFYPSCSNYALEAIQIHGAGRGSALALRRLSRCRP